MILEILLLEYVGISAFNSIVPIIKKNRARRNIIKMFEDNGYDVDEHYIDIIFKKYKPDRYQSEQLYEEASFYDIAFRYLPGFQLYNLVMNTKYLTGDYSNTINHFYDSYWDIKQYEHDHVIDCLECDKVLKNNPEKKRLCEDKKKAMELLKRKESGDIESLKSKYENYSEYLDLYSERYSIDRSFLEDYFKNMLEDNLDEDFIRLSPKSKVLEAVHRIKLYEEKYLKSIDKIGDDVDLLHYSDGTIKLSTKKDSVLTRDLSKIDYDKLEEEYKKDEVSVLAADLDSASRRRHFKLVNRN